MGKTYLFWAITVFWVVGPHSDVVLVLVLQPSEHKVMRQMTLGGEKRKARGEKPNHDKLKWDEAGK